MIKLGFKGALLASISFLVALAVGVTNYLSYVSARDALQSTIYQNTQQRVAFEAEKLENFLASKAKAVADLANDYQQYQYTDDHFQRVRVSAFSADVGSIMVGFDNGDAYASFAYENWIGHKNPASYDPRVRPWYGNAKKTDQVIYTDVYSDAMTKELMVSVGKAFSTGVVLADISLKVFDQAVKKIDFPGALAVIVSEDSTALASTSGAIAEGKKLSDDEDLGHIANEVIGQSAIQIEYRLKGKDKVLFSNNIKVGDKNWYLIIALEKEVVFADLYAARTNTIILTLISLIISVLLVLLIINYLYRPILTLKATINSLSSGDGDLTQRLDIKSNDDLGQIALGVNSFIESLQLMILEMATSTTKLQEDVNQLTSQTQKNAEILSLHQEETEQIVTAIEQMNATAGSVAQHAAKTAQFTAEAMSMGGESLQAVNDAQSKVTYLMEEVEDTAGKIQQMGAETKGIRQILEVIGGIADQTNLLALNAAIEAARAGEQGRGFAVVADEVRALASRTQVSTGEVEKALDGLMKGSQSTSDSIEVTKVTCNDTFGSTELVSERINGLSKHIVDINDLSTQIATAAEEQSHVTQEVNRNMASINEMVNELRINGEKTTTQTQSVSLVNTQLNQIIQKFKLK